MDEAGDMAALAIPFAAGSAAGYFAARLPGPVSWVLPGALLGAVAALLPLLRSVRRPAPGYGLLFFLLGAFCQCPPAPRRCRKGPARP